VNVPCISACTATGTTTVAIDGSAPSFEVKLIMGTRPGRLKRDLAVNLARPRGANDRDVAEMSLVVERELRIEIEKVIREELDDAWTGANGALPRDPGGDLGDGI
jgi:NitT/TauT family transport system ATP-binding protein